MRFGLWSTGNTSQTATSVSDDVKRLVTDVAHRIISSLALFLLPPLHCRASSLPVHSLPLNSPLQLHLIVTPLFCSSSLCTKNAGNYLTASYKQG